MRRRGEELVSVWLGGEHQGDQYVETVIEELAIVDDAALDLLRRLRRHGRAALEFFEGNTRRIMLLRLLPA